MDDETKQDIETENSEKNEAKTEESKGVINNVTTVDIAALKKEVGDLIRKEEKDKLYPQLSQLKNDKEEAEKRTKELEDKLKEYESKNLSAEEQQGNKLKELEESNEKLKGTINELVQEANNKITALELALAKEKIVAMYGDDIISELVSGNTIEELKESAEKAHSMYTSIAEKAKKKETETAKIKDPVGTGITPSSDKVNNSSVLTDIDSITNKKDWEKNRAKFVEEARKTLI